MYKIINISKDRWIFISAEFSTDEPDSFINLVKEYQSHVSGQIVKVSDDMQYSINNDPLSLIFQWDSLFGITVIVPDEIDISIAEKTMNHICDKLNNQKN